MKKGTRKARQEWDRRHRTRRAMIMRCLVLVVILLLCGPPSRAGNIQGKLTLRGERNSADAVVFIEKVAAWSFPPPAQHASMDQKNLRFIPHVLPILVGTTVDYYNSDTVLHNIFSPDTCANEFDLGMWPRGNVKSHTFTKPGCEAVMLCNVHPEMEAYIVVLETPYYAITPPDGRFTIRGVPAGTYTLGIWHEGVKRASRRVSVPERGTVPVDVTLEK